MHPSAQVITNTMMMQEHLIVPSESGGANGTTGPSSSSPLTNANRNIDVGLNVSISHMTAMVGSPPPNQRGGAHLQQGTTDTNPHHHIHHHSGGQNISDTRYGIFSEKFESFQGGPGGGIGDGLWQSHHPPPPPPPIQNVPNHQQQQITQLNQPNVGDNEDITKQQLQGGLMQRCGSNNSAAAAGTLTGQQHPDLLPPGYMEHHQKVQGFSQCVILFKANFKK